MREAKYRIWLQAQEYAANSVNTKLSDARRVDGAHGDLDEHFRNDGMASLLATFAYSKTNEAEGRANPTALPIEGNLYNNLSGYRSALTTYRRFREAQDHPDGRLAGLDRDAIIQAITACDAAGSAEAFVSGLEDRGVPQKYWLVHGGKRYPSKAIVHWAMRERGIEASAGGSLCKATLEELGFVVVDWPELERARQDFLRRTDGFTSFADNSGAYWDTERGYKNELIARARDIADGDGDDRAAGEALYRLLSVGGQGLPLSWRTLGEANAAAPDLKDRFYTGIGALARSVSPAGESITETARELEALRAAGIAGLRRGEVAAIPITVWATLHPEEASWFKISKIEAMGKRFFGRPLFTQTEFREADLEEWLQLMRALFALMEREWGWEPRDLFDVQGFIWVALGGNEKEEFLNLYDDEGTRYRPLMQANQQTGVVAYRIKTGPDNTTASATETQSLEDVAKALLIEKLPVRIAKDGDSHANYLTFPGKLVRWEMSASLADALGLSSEGPGRAPLTPGKGQENKMLPPTNLILYGPPGTGKTYRTASEAVRLCDEGAAYGDDAQGRAALMTRYAELVDAGRIEFVTFHQNFSYEDFVEGLRPPISKHADAEEGAEPAGLRLEVHPGIFRDIAQRAQLDRGSAPESSLDPQRSVFKIALGERGSEEQAIRTALDDGEITLGWGGNIDWTDSRFDEFSAILAHWQNGVDSVATGKDANVEQIFALRAWMQEGDYVVVSDGRDRFRAFGEVTGPYKFQGTHGRHPHRRKVRWLWRDDNGVDRSLFYPRGFRRHSLYRLDPTAIDWVALARVVDGGGEVVSDGDPRPHVLIIDEINRANISKVFGELITLIEPDKRLGRRNALKVRLPYSKREFGVPANLHIIGTMNTADRSIALLDTALRRRFQFEEIAPDPALLPVEVDGVQLRRVLTVINDRIEYLHDREHRIGHAFFMGCDNRSAIDAAMHDKVLPLLQEYFFDDWSRIAAVVGEGFIARRKLDPPPGIEVGEDRISWSVRKHFADNAYTMLLGKTAALASAAEEVGDDA